MLPNDKVRRQQENCNLEIENKGHGKNSADLIISRWGLGPVLKINVNLVYVPYQLEN